MDKNLIISAITPDVEALGAFIVDVTVSNANDIEIIIEKDADSVTWDDCSALDKAFHEKFNQDEEDYALTVSSAGLDRPFKVMRQFQKAVGTVKNNSLFVPPGGGGAGEYREHPHQDDEGANKHGSPFHGAKVRISENNTKRKTNFFHFYCRARVPSSLPQRYK